MQINKFIVKNFIYSAFVAIFSCLIVFFIFSLIGNLNDDHHFLKIIIISLLNSLQIMFFIPSIIFLLIIYLFCHFLMAKNEIMILRQYVPKSKIITILIFFLITIASFEVNKSNFIDYIENIKLKFLNDKNNHKIKLIINSYLNEEEYMVFKNIDTDNRIILKFNYFKINDDSIENSIYSENQTYSDDLLELSSFYQQSGNDIYNINDSKVIYIENLVKFIKNNKFVNFNKFENLKFKLNLFLQYFHYLILFSLILIMSMNGASLQRNQKLIKSTLWGILLIIYSYILFNLNFVSFSTLFIILGITVISVIFLKNLIYE